MLEKMVLKDICPSCIFCVKKDVLFSIQKDSHARALRFFKCNKNYFKSFSAEETDKPFEIADMNQFLDMVKKHEAGKTVTCYVEGNNLFFESMIGDEKEGLDPRKSSVPIQEPDSVIEKLPIEMDENGVPSISAGEDESVVMDKWCIIDLARFRSFVEFANPVKTEFFKFWFEDGKIKAEVRDLKMPTAPGNVDKLKGTIKNGKNLEVIFTYGIHQIAESFTKKEFSVRTNTHSPGWFYEGDNTYTYGVLLPPYTQEE